MDTSKTQDSIKCPFCGEDGFDLVGLKAHLTGEGFLVFTGCEGFKNTLTIDEERRLREIKRHNMGGSDATT